MLSMASQSRFQLEYAYRVVHALRCCPNRRPAPRSASRLLVLVLFRADRPARIADSVLTVPHRLAHQRRCPPIASSVALRGSTRNGATVAHHRSAMQGAMLPGTLALRTTTLRSGLRRASRRPYIPVRTVLALLLWLPARLPTKVARALLQSVLPPALFAPLFSPEAVSPTSQASPCRAPLVPRSAQCRRGIHRLQGELLLPVCLLDP